MMNSHTKVREFVVGIDYDDIAEDRGHLTLRRKVPIEELILEIQSIIRNGSTYPQFPPRANPTLTYVWDLSNQDDGDCYHELMQKLEKDNRKENIY